MDLTAEGLSPAWTVLGDADALGSGLGGTGLEGGVGLEDMGLWDPGDCWVGSGPGSGCGLEAVDQLVLSSGRKVRLS